MAFELRRTLNVVEELIQAIRAGPNQLVELTTHPSSMSESSRKRAAISSLGSEFDKKSRLGLTDEELNDLNENLRDWMQLLKGNPDYAPTDPGDISTRVLAQTFREVVVYLLDTSRASTMDESWKKVKYGEERINLLSSEEKLELASIWVEARGKGDWERFAGQCASIPSRLFPE